MPDLSSRYDGLEIMDDLNASGDDLDQALRELDAINRILGGNNVTVDGVRVAIQGRTLPSRLRVADIGCGSGAMLERLARFFLKIEVPVELVGIDANENVIRFARVHSSREIQFICTDIFSSDFQSQRFDLVTATLFFHHFTDEQLINFLRQLRTQVATAIVINDIHRHWFAYHSIRILTRVFSRSRMVTHDGPVSVMRAFRRKELEMIFIAAGYKKFDIRWRWAFRWQAVVWS